MNAAADTLAPPSSSSILHAWSCYESIFGRDRIHRSMVMGMTIRSMCVGATSTISVFRFFLGVASYGETCDGDVLRLLQILEMLRFLESERKVLKKLPNLTAQQAVNQPRGSIPEMLGLLELVSEPKGKVRHGKMSARAKAAEEETSRARKKLHLYSPIAGYRALPGGAPTPKTRIETVQEEGEIGREPGSERAASVSQALQRDGSASSGGEASHLQTAMSPRWRDDADDRSSGGLDEPRHVDSFRRSGSADNKTIPRPASLEPALTEAHRKEEVVDEDQVQDEGVTRHSVWIEHVNKESLSGVDDKRMGIAFMHVAMSSDEVRGFHFIVI